MSREYKKYLLLLSVLLFAVQFGYAKSRKEIEWVTFEQLAELQATAPKKVLISVYTQWCGWCKRMDKQIFANEELAEYVNDHFYAVRLDAEDKNSINFKGNTYHFNKEYKVNELAAALLQGQMSYPSTIIMMEDMVNVETFPGFIELPIMEALLNFFGSNNVIKQSWQEFHKDFKASWIP